ncbi:hypothetical protein SAMN02745194_01772 [Roseomonas rosea]|uniref:Uncharacterized protein n=1 Tax=Muricoccus roseus TaxID=198092 RepID=A0A1M6GJ86_9PROT|nr:hypothetical protein [Roseomonas rosea]SHJ09982.1 hypothetical protein SAMN02745194_01772 [Roseomonas rosea]
MPYLIEAILFLAPFALYALWLRLNPGQAVGTHVIALAVLGLTLSIGGAIWYGLSRGMDPNAVYVPPRATESGIVPGHVGPAPPPEPRPR